MFPLVRRNLVTVIALFGATIATGWLGREHALAQDGIAQVYSRSRSGADYRHARRGAWMGYPGYGNYGYYQPWAPPIVAGTWYARPYPYHFDYYRGRWDGPATAQQAPQSDCPCVTDGIPAATQ